MSISADQRAARLAARLVFQGAVAYPCPEEGRRLWREGLENPQEVLNPLAEQLHARRQELGLTELCDRGFGQSMRLSALRSAVMLVWRTASERPIDTTDLVGPSQGEEDIAKTATLLGLCTEADLEGLVVAV